MLVWKTNYTNPYKPLHSPLTAGNENFLQALQREKDLYDRFVKGRPQAIDTYSVEELEAMGTIGLYEDVKDED